MRGPGGLTKIRAGRDVGSLSYEGRTYELPDRTLTHLQIVISTKLRRHEAFTLSWRVSPDAGSGRHVLWIGNGVPIHFDYSAGRPGPVNREWIEALLNGASSPDGLKLMEEPISAD
jgi:hypothetical protein